MSLNVKIYNELTKTKEVILLNARVIDSPIDIIIGRPTITQHKLLRKCHDQILSDTRLINYDHSPLSGLAFLKNDLWLQLNMLTAVAEQTYFYEPSGVETPPEEQTPAQAGSKDTSGSTQTDRLGRQQPEEDPEKEGDETKVGPKEWFRETDILIGAIDVHPLVSRLKEVKNDTVQTTLMAMLGVIGQRVQEVDSHKLIIPHQLQKKVEDIITSEDVCDGDIISKHALLQHSDDGFDQSDLIHQSEDDPQYGKAPSIDEYLQVQVHGSDKLQKEIRQIIHKYKEVFTSILPAQAARVTPLHLDVDPSAWIKPSNMAPTRRQSTTKDVEINEQTQEMLYKKVITESLEAQAWSQV